MNMRLFMCTLALLAVAGTSGCVTRMSGRVDSAYDIIVLHTNDTHAYVAGMDARDGACTDPSNEDCVGGTARLASAIQASRADNTLLLDAGDHFQGTLFYSVNKWPMLADLEAPLKYDATTPGNHEFDEGCADLADFYRALDVPVLAANMELGPTCPLGAVPAVRPWIIRQVRGEKVGIVGLVTPDVPRIASPCQDMRFTDPATALRRAVAELEARGVRRIIALTHVGLEEDKRLARAVDGVDVIVGGHSHSWLASAREGDSPEGAFLPVAAKGAEGPYPVVETSPSGQPVLIVTARYGTRYLGSLSLNFDQGGVPAAWGGEAKLLDSAVSPNSAVARQIAEYGKSLELFRAELLGEHALNYADGMEVCRAGDCLAGMIISDAMLDYGRPYGAVAALINGGSLRAPLKPGAITQGDVLEIIPFGNTLFIREYTGADILAALAFSADVENGHGGRLLQVAGLRYVFDSSRPEGQRFLSAELVDAQGKASPILPQSHYKIVVTDFLARGGDNYHTLAQGKPVDAPDSMDADVVSAFIRAHSPLTMPVDGRIRKANSK